MVDATAGGSLMRTYDDDYQLLDDMANNAFNWQSKRANRKSAGIHSIDTLSSLSAQIKLLNKKWIICMLILTKLKISLML